MQNEADTICQHDFVDIVEWCLWLFWHLFESNWILNYLTNKWSNYNLYTVFVQKCVLLIIWIFRLWHLYDTLSTFQPMCLVCNVSTTHRGHRFVVAAGLWWCWLFMIGSFRRRLRRSSMIGKASFSFFNAQQRASCTHITKKTLRRRIAICCYVRRKEYVYAILYVYSCKSTRAARNGCAFHFGPSSVQRTGSCISSNSKQLPPTYDPTRLNDTATKHNEYKRIFLRQLSYEHERTPQRYGHRQPTHQRCTLFNGKRIRGDYWVRVVRNNKKRLRTTQLYILCTLYYTQPASSTPSHHHQHEMICGSNSTVRMNAPAWAPSACAGSSYYALW